ncbi:MAG: hypothetical protein AAB470_03220 [Patescibacteria group bacterium]
MTKQLKTLAVVVVIAAVILVIAAITAPKSVPTQVTGDASLSLINQSGGNVEVGQIQNIKWTSSNYIPKTVGVNIIRKVSDNPASYELVRTVASATLNDGSAVWVPAKTDAGDNIFVEVACAVSAQECRASESTVALAVLDTGLYSNTAAAYQAIEANENK